MKIVKQSVELLWITDNPEKQIEVAGRTCYKSNDKITDKSAGRFVEMLRKRGHHAMLEHASASFRIVTDRGVTHEIVRHRIASYAQVSTRYCNFSKDKFGNECTFIEPPSLNRLMCGYWKDACIFAEKQYMTMLRAGARPEIARSVLPTCLMAEIVMTANLREWRHFIALRKSPAAHPQIREIAMGVLRALHEKAASVFADLT